MNKEAQRIIAKYPGHIPVICAQPNVPDSKKKFLIPSSMMGRELAVTVRGKCPWAGESSSVRVGEQLVPEGSSASDLYERLKAADGYLYMIVSIAGDATPKSSRNIAEISCMGDNREAPTGAACQATVMSPPSPKSEEKAQMSKSQVCIFHMPDFEEDAQVEATMSEEATKVHKVIRKHPDHVPVLIRQAATAGLPYLDKKLLVPRSMTCAALEKVMPKHLGLPQDVAGNGILRIHMCGEPLLQEVAMSDVYDESVDKDDGGLHLTLGIEGYQGKVEAQEEAEEKNAARAPKQDEGASDSLREALQETKERLEVTEQVRRETQEVLEGTEQVLRETQERLQETEQALAESRDSALKDSHRSAVAEALQDEQRKASEESEEQARAAAERAAIAEETLTSLRRGHEELAKSQGEANSKLEAANDQIRTLTQERDEAVRELHEVRAQSDEKERLQAQRADEAMAAAWKAQVAAEAAEKTRAQANTKRLEERVAALEEEAKRHSSSPASGAEADGFVDLGWDGDGYNGGLCVDNDFEVVSGRR